MCMKAKLQVEASLQPELPKYTCYMPVSKYRWQIQQYVCVKRTARIWPSGYYDASGYELYC